MRPVIALAAAVLLAACEPQAPDGSTAAPPADAPDTAPAPAAAEIPAAFEGDLDARGTEPFWAVQVRPTQITLMRPDHADVVAPNPGPVMLADRAVWTVPTAAGETLVLSLWAQPDCSDGMSDLRYPLAAELKVGTAEPMQGCGAKTAEMPTEAGG